MSAQALSRIAVAGFRHASSTRLPTRATLEEFGIGTIQPRLCQGEAMLPAIAGRNLALAGAVEQAGVLGHAVVPLVWAAASASGPVVEDAFEHIMRLLLEELAAAGPVDGVALSLHGAMVATHIPDADGEIVRRVRAAVGAAVPILVMVDWNANIGPLLVAHATEIVAERSCPATGAAETGRRGARVLDRLIRSGRRPARCYRRLPFTVPVAAGAPDAAPAAGLLAALAEAETRPGIDGLAMALGFPEAELPHARPCVLGYGTDRAIVERAVSDLAAAMAAVPEWRPDWRMGACDPAAAVARALAQPRDARPVLLAEIDDDPDAGGTGDGMALAHALRRAGAADAVIAFVYDPHVTIIAHRAGVGARLPLSLGAKHGRPGGEPLAGTFLVEALAEGPCVCPGPVHRGAAVDPGPLAVLRLDGLRLVLATRRIAADDRQLLAHAGIAPETVPILAVKSALAYRADLAPHAAMVIPVASS